MKRSTLLHMLIVASFVLIVLTQDCFAQSGCSLLDQSRRAQFITYDYFGDFTGIVLRLTNNTSCTITIETDDIAPMRFVKVPNGKTLLEVFSGSRDGAVVRLHYLIQNRRRGRAPNRAYGWGDSVFTYDIPAGQSVLFSVLPKHFKDRLDIVVPFQYAWESASPIGLGVGGVIHHVYFLVEDLPKEIANKTKKLGKS